MHIHTHTHMHIHIHTHTHTHMHTQISSDQKLTEFFEGDPCKFCLVTGDHRIHLKSNTLDLKQDWVKALRTAILQSPGKNKVKTERHDKSLLSVDSWVKDLRVPSPSVSPEARRKMNGAVVGHETPPPLPAFDRVSVSLCASCVCIMCCVLVSLCASCVCVLRVSVCLYRVLCACETVCFVCLSVCLCVCIMCCVLVSLCASYVCLSVCVSVPCVVCL